MRVFAYLPTTKNLTGAPRRLLSLAIGLRSQGIEVFIAAEPGTPLLRAAEKEPGILVQPLALTPGVQASGVRLFAGGALAKARTLLALLWHNLQVYRALRQTQADVIWLRGAKGMVLAGLAAWLSRCCVIWDVDYEEPSRGLLWVVHQLGLKLSTRVVFQYRACAEDVFGGGSAKRFRHKLVAITPGIKVEPLQEAARDRAGGAEVADGAEFAIVQVGTLCDRKNQLFLVEALAEAGRIRDISRWKLRLVGGVHEPEYAEQLRRRVNELGLGPQVVFEGWREDVLDLISAADLVAMPSRNEGVPNAVQEAMACGVPVIVSDAGGQPEIVEDGVSGWVRPLDHPGAWAECLLECAADPELRERLGNNAARFAKDNFTIAVWARKYAETIQAAQTNSAEAADSSQAD